MPRGGKREGAGRPRGSSVLDSVEQIMVVNECEKRRTAIQDVRLKAARDALFSKSDYDALIASIKAEPLEDRRQYIPTEDEAGEEEYPTFAGEQHHDDVEGARKLMAGLDVDDPQPAPRGFRIRASRPHHYRARLLEDVAAWASAKFDKRVSASLVDSCWKRLGKVGPD